MPRRKPTAPTSLVPIEALLIGAWITLILLARLLDLPASQISWVRHVEVLFGAFLTLLTLRRQARGVSLLLPFAALTITLLFESILLTPQPKNGTGGQVWLVNLFALLDLLKVLIVFGIFVLNLRRVGRS